MFYDDQYKTEDGENSLDKSNTYYLLLRTFECVPNGTGNGTIVYTKDRRLEKKASLK